MDKHAARDQEKKRDRTKISKQKTTPESAKTHNEEPEEEKIK